MQTKFDSGTLLTLLKQLLDEVERNSTIVKAKGCGLKHKERSISYDDKPGV